MRCRDNRELVWLENYREWVRNFTKYFGEITFKSEGSSSIVFNVLVVKVLPTSNYVTYFIFVLIYYLKSLLNNIEVVSSRISSVYCLLDHHCVLIYQCLTEIIWSSIANKSFLSSVREIFSFKSNSSNGLFPFMYFNNL